MSETPTARELLDSIGDKPALLLYVVHDAHILAARVEAVLALHVAAGIPEPFVPGPRYCKGCGCAWPCPTRRALEGKP